MNKIANKMITRLVLLTIGCLLAGISLMAQVSESKQIRKSFRIEKSTIVDINNKYGDVTIETWENDSVLVIIDYTISEKNYERLRSRAEQIRFELSKSGHYLVVNTIIGSNKNMLLGELARLKESIGMNESQVQINIKVFMPDNLDLRIKNKFGNVFIED